MIPPPHAPAFLDRAGWDGAEILPLAGDASFRRYFRVRRAGDSAVLMDAPPEHEDSRPFLAVAAHLDAIGFRAPRVLAQDLEGGLILLEDFGDARMKEAIEADPAAEAPIYAQAIDLLADLHGHAAGPLPPYDMAVYQREAGLLPEWYMPAVGLDADPAGYAAAWDAALAPIAHDRSVSVLRDYHAENIMLLGDGGLGLLDFQDALAGHPAYDLVSLLQDARRDVPPAIETAMIARYAARRPFDEAAYALLGAQRNAKILGIFTRLWKRDGKPRYLAFQPRVWGYLERDLAHPALTPVKAWFDANLPAAKRAAHWREQAA
ncbi:MULTISPECIES: aminoglycoside phosphotransferase family protein [unclassified Sphingomonas]|uniref:aminoglycoside phosphotransferase family protein n=1 Tax=unclassified Sphingomonas TaxID=196159 RepID=UPI0006FE3C3E|nr:MULTISPECIES: phosphotransferase [unclassified Sphingomonas]KQX21574.1 aminoglycoside phosphotransferase [Sphingomonas sp. Root1294]KQY72891.1 aminoglycoside phosphotransferase [Sphingomonas sp. Root50]KRB88316.1 aminoglycoside phosphotransferase [Sphingomonas sp. Root720]